MSSRSLLFNFLSRRAKDKLISTRGRPKSGGLLSTLSTTSSSRRFGSAAGRRSISDDSAHSNSHKSDQQGQSAGSSFDLEHLTEAARKASIRAASLRMTANSAIDAAARAETDAARALSRAPAGQALSDQTKQAAALRSRAVEAVAAADRAQTEAAEARAGDGTGAAQLREADFRASELRGKANEAVAAADHAEAEVASAQAAMTVAVDARARAEALRASANEAVYTAELAEIDARGAKAIAEEAAISVELGARIVKAQAESTKAQADSAKSQKTIWWFQYGSLLVLGATGVRIRVQYYIPVYVSWI